MTLPVLYSLRNCPFAMRARLAIYKAQIPVELREVNLKNKPAEMLLASSKGTVPTLVISPQTVLDESLDVMLWALDENDPSSLFNKNHSEILDLIKDFDTKFKPSLEQYKCAKRYHEPNLVNYRASCEIFIKALEQRLLENDYLTGSNESIADIAILPYIRQFSKVEKPWFKQSNYIQVRCWLNRYIQSPMFTKVMAKFPLWTNSSSASVFGDC